MKLKSGLRLLPLLLSITANAAASPMHEHINSSREKIEFYWSKPEGKGPFPALMLIHPDQKTPKNGGESFVKYGQLDYWTQRGYVAIAISQPGYGGSEGSADFCGPRSQQAAVDVIKHFQAMPEVNSNRFFIYGGSRGAVIAGMLAAQDLSLRGLILKSGVYDFVEWARMRPWYDSITIDMFWEIGWVTEKKLIERSAYYLADRIKTPLLIIHGSQDDRAPVALAEKFASRVNEAGGKAKFVKIESEHVIPMPKINGLMEEFMKGLL